VGRPHGLDGSFYVEPRASSSAAAEGLDVGAAVTVGDLESVVERRGGTDARPLIRIAGVDDREAAAALRGQTILVAGEDRLEAGEYMVDDLVGCEVPGLGVVGRVLGGPSCDLLEVGPDAVLVPLVSDAIREVDLDARVIEVDHGFLGTPPGATPPTPRGEPGTPHGGSPPASRRAPSPGGSLPARGAPSPGGSPPASRGAPSPGGSPPEASP
jgi:16S rRNA processing protein RimM